MRRTHPPRRSYLVACMALILAIVSACAATAGPKAPCAASPQGGLAGANTVFRPIYGAAPTRPLFLSGYAGVNYAAGTPGAALSPTRYDDRPGRRFGSLFGRHAPGR